MARRVKIYEGKAKILYEGPEPGTLVQYFKDDATAYNAEKKDVIMDVFPEFSKTLDSIKTISSQVFGQLEVNHLTQDDLKNMLDYYNNGLLACADHRD